MACGCPVVTSGVSALPEVAGGAALLIDPTATEELAAAIDLTLSCDRARGRGGACAGGFSAPNRVDPIIRRYLSWTVLGKRAMGAG